MKFYSENEIKKLINDNEKLVLVQTGDEEIIVRYKDISDFVIDYVKKNGHGCRITASDLSTGAFMFNTMGWFLDRCDADVRKDIINRMISLQMGGKVKSYKVIDPNIYDEIYDMDYEVKM